ncbi:MAG: aminoacyl-tRNA hydrolase [Pirellulales bacterium]|nr:aminoacyl-tRNA hydrolase [Pirellulales bacterium]
MLIIANQLRIPLREFEFTYSRSSGPGGQNVNKLNTKALLRWRATASSSLPESVLKRLKEKYPRRITSDGDLLIASQRFRDAGRNTADCLEKLRLMLVEAAKPVKSRKTTRPTRASVRRRIEHKRRHARKKIQRRGPDPDCC